MGAIPQHPFFLRVIESLQSYDRSWVLPYITVMYSTGPLFLSVVWKEYMLSEPDEIGRVRILMPDEYNKHSWSFFTHHEGSSWHGKDARLIFWVSIFVRSYKHLHSLTCVDGWPLDAPHHHRLPPRWCRRFLSLVGLRPTAPPGIVLPLPLLEALQPLEYPLSHLSGPVESEVPHAIFLPSHEPEKRRRRKLRCERHALRIGWPAFLNKAGKRT